jgi:hypothetical protein
MILNSPTSTPVLPTLMFSPSLSARPTKERTHSSTTSTDNQSFPEFAEFELEPEQPIDEDFEPEQITEEENNEDNEEDINNNETDIDDNEAYDNEVYNEPNESEPADTVLCGKHR